MFSVDVQGALNNRKKSIITDPQGMHAVLGRITVTVLPKMCQQILESIISADNLYCSFQNRNDLKIILVEEEQAIITTMVSNGYKHFTVQLCYKILRHEQWVGTPRQNWGNVPLHTDMHISDDIERIRLSRNKIVSMETKNLDETTFLTLMDEFREIAKRVDFYLKKDVMFVLQIQPTESMTKLEIESAVDEIRRLSVIEDNPFPVHTIKQGRTNYARLGLVVVDIFPNILREIMRSNIAPEVLYRHIRKQHKNNPSVFDKMTHEERISLNTLTNRTYDNIDFITMYKLLRSFSLLDDPTQGWGKQPTNADVTISDDVERLRIARNKIVHRIKADIDLIEMSDYFSNIVHITQRIDTYLGKGFAREVLNFQTHCMDSEMEQKYYQALKDIEDIKEKFSVESVHFYYGKTFTNFIQDVQNKAKSSVRKTISLVLEDINDDEKRRILNELKTEINTGLVNIEFKQAVSGSLIIYIDILDSNLLATEHELGHQIYMFLCRALQLTGFNMKTENEITVVLIKEEDDIEVEFSIESDNWETYDDEIGLRSNSLCLELDVNTEIFNTEQKMQSEFGLFVKSVLGSNGKSNTESVSARLEPGIVGAAQTLENVDRESDKNESEQRNNDGKQTGTGQIDRGITTYAEKQMINEAGTTKKKSFLYKIIVIGDLGAGKTCIIKQYIHHLFHSGYRATLGVDFSLKVLNWDADTIIKLQLWDIAGQERFGNMTRVYYKDAIGCFIVCDVTRKSTLEGAKLWKADFDRKVTVIGGSPVPCVLLANKCDLVKDGLAEDIPQYDELCKKEGFEGWFKTSAKDNINIDESTRFLVTKIVRNDRQTEVTETDIV